MKHYYNILFLLTLLPAIVVANNGKLKGKYTKEKKIHKEYTVNANAGFQLDNSFGNVTISTWNENRTVIDVVITTNGNNEAKVTERLNDITVAFTANGSKVSATTEFDKKSNWKSWWGKGKNNVSAEVNYTIKLPVNNTVNLSNDYGTITLDQLMGNAKISCDYGQLIIGELMADDNYLNFDHTNNSTIRYMKSGKINADYSGFRLDKAEKLELNSDHSNSDIGEVGDLNYNNDYGKISVEKVTTVIGRGDHISHNFGNVAGSLNINTDYGGVRVDRVEPSCKQIQIRSEYAPIVLGLAPGYTFTITADLTYTNFKGKEMMTFTKQHVEHSDSRFEGYFGNKNSGNTININANYGTITFKKL